MNIKVIAVMVSRTKTWPRDMREVSKVQAGMTPLFNGKQMTIFSNIRELTEVKYDSLKLNLSIKPPMTASMDCPAIYKSDCGKLVSPAKNIDMVMNGLTCPPESGTAAQMKSVRARRLKREPSIEAVRILAVPFLS